MWQQVSENIHSVTYAVKGIPETRSHLLTLPDGSTLVYSPPIVGESNDGIIEAANAIGPVRHLVIPSNYHTLGVTRWHEKCPDARIYAELTSAERMGKLGLTFTDWRQLNGLMPEGASIELAPLKFGELWISWPTPVPTLLVCEAFFNFEPSQIKGFVKIPATLLDNGPGLKVSRVVKWFQDSSKSYDSWARDYLERHQPKRLLATHGQVIEDENLSAILLAALERRFPK